MTIKELKEVIQDLPDDMLVGLWDLSTDDLVDGNYSLEKENFIIDDYVRFDDPNEIAGKMLFIIFENKLNENNINDMPL